MEIYEKMTNQAGMLIVSINLAEVQARLGDYAGAIDTARRVAAQSRVRRDERLLTNALVILTNYHLLAGDDAAAAHTAREALPLLTDQDDKGLDACFTGGLALLAARLGGLETAAILAGNASHYYRSNELTMEPVEQRVWDTLLSLFDAADIAGRLTAADLARIMAQGAAQSLQDVLRLGTGWMS